MRSKAYILVVDDEKDVRDMLCDGLTHRNFTADVAASGEDAIDKIKRNNYDLVILDINLPGIDGLQVLREIKHVNETLSVIMITAYGSMERVKESMRHGACDYIEKPLTIDKILIAVRRALEERRLKATVSLYEVSKAILSTIEIDELVEEIVERAMEIFNADDASIMLFDEKEKLYIAVSHGLDEEIKRKTRLAVGERIAGWAAQHDEPLILINGLKDDPRFKDINGREEISSSIVIPLKKDDRVIGVFNANRINIKENFTESDLYRVKIFVSLVGLAINNACVYKAAKEKHQK